MTRLATRFLSSINEHKEAMRLVDRRLRFWTEDRARNPVPRFNLPAYFQRNLFSILFLAVYEHLGIPKSRRVLYAAINRCVRGVVTGADNILDDEYNQVFGFTGLPDVSTKYLSVITVLLSHAVFDDVLRQQEDAGVMTQSQATEIKLGLALDLFAIGEEDAREGGGPRRILKPEEVREKVHESKGAKLLALAMRAPRVVETDVRALDIAEEAIRTVGMGLQMLDDLADIEEDVREGKDNYLVSYVHHRGSGRERDVLATVLDGDPPAEAVEQSYPDSVPHIVRECRETAVSGLRKFNTLGEFLRERDALTLLKLLFLARGVGQLWKLAK